MRFEEILGMAIPATYLMMLLVEQFRPAREFPAVRGWKLTGLMFTAMIVSLNATALLWLGEEWIQRHRLIDGPELGVTGGAIAGLLAATLAGYWWHRAEHRFGVLWRVFHQLHHSPRRVDISGAAFVHPFEMAANAALAMGVNVLVLGLNPVAASIAGYASAFCALFSHWNVRTPQWLGYLLPRPEAHCVHHEMDVHAFNYGDLPLWDLVFGTFRNPQEFTGDVGFQNGSKRLLEMLLGRDVHRGGIAAALVLAAPVLLGGVAQAGEFGNIYYSIANGWAETAVGPTRVLMPMGDLGNPETIVVLTPGMDGVGTRLETFLSEAIEKTQQGRVILASRDADTQTGRGYTAMFRVVLSEAPDGQQLVYTYVAANPCGRGELAIVLARDSEAFERRQAEINFILSSVRFVNMTAGCRAEPAVANPGPGILEGNWVGVYQKPGGVQANYVPPIWSNAGIGASYFTRSAPTETVYRYHFQAGGRVCALQPSQECGVFAVQGTVVAVRMPSETFELRWNGATLVDEQNGNVAYTRER